MTRRNRARRQRISGSDFRSLRPRRLIRNARGRNARGFEQLESRNLLAVFVVNTADRPDQNNLSDPTITTFAEALASANATVEHDTIEFSADLSFKTIAPVSTTFRPLEIQNDLTIDASNIGLIRIGVKSPQRHSGRIFKVLKGVEAEFSNLIIEGGKVEQGIGSSNENFGGGIWNAGTLTLRNSIVGGNAKLDGNKLEGDYIRTYLGGGGGIYNSPDGTLTLSNTHVGSLEIDDTVIAKLGLDRNDYVFRKQPNEPSGRTEFVPNNFAEGVGGGILNEGTLVVRDNSSIAHNHTQSPGAGIYNAGAATITDSVIEHNNTFGTNVDGFGIGIYNSTKLIFQRVQHQTEPIKTLRKRNSAFEGQVSLILKNSVIASNRFDSADFDVVSWGTGIYNEIAPLRIVDSTLTANHAYHGGTLFNQEGPVDIVGSTFHGNGGTQGGAIGNRWNTMTIESSTISGNSAIRGGGIINHSNSGGTSLLQIRNSTITDNTATSSGSGIETLGQMTVYNSIVAGNQSSDDIFKSDGAQLSSEGSNLLGNTIGGFDYVTDDPLLGPLGDHGGPTMTHVPLPGSPAINATLDDSADLPESDQRGFRRVIGQAFLDEFGFQHNGSDIGAVESIPPSSMRVDTLSGEIDGYYADGEFSLGEAILWANAIPGPDTIGFSDELLDEIRKLDGGMGTIVLPNEIPISDDLKIHGPGASLLSISGGGPDDPHRVFHVNSDATVEIVGVTIRDGYLPSGWGAGILNDGDLTLSEVVMTGNRALRAGHKGGAIANRGTLLVNASTFYDNEADEGGTLWTNSEATIVNTTISGNRSNSGAGLRVEGGTANVINSTVVFNDGAGLNRALGSLNVTNSIVAGNSGQGNLWGVINAPLTRT